MSVNWVVAGRGRLGGGGSVSFFQLGFQNLLPESIKTHKFEAFEKMDAEPGITATAATATMDFKLLALAVFTAALMVAIFSGGPLRNMTIYGITHSILKPLCLLVCCISLRHCCILLLVSEATCIFCFLRGSSPAVCLND